MSHMLCAVVLVIMYFRLPVFAMGMRPSRATIKLNSELAPLISSQSKFVDFVPNELLHVVYRRFKRHHISSALQKTDIYVYADKVPNDCDTPPPQFLYRHSYRISRRSWPVIPGYRLHASYANVFPMLFYSPGLACSYLCTCGSLDSTQHVTMSR